MYENFWNWFLQHEKEFFNVVKHSDNIEELFFNKLSPQLDIIKEGIFFLAGMLAEDTAELVFTPDGKIKNIVFIEELVAAAPALPNWKFTALKQSASDGEEGFSIDMGGFGFSRDNLSFHVNELDDYPELIDLFIVYQYFNEEDKYTITNGVYIFLDNYLGELNAVTLIERVRVIGINEIQAPLVPITGLKEYLLKREHSYLKKYRAFRKNTENDSYSSFQGTLNNGWPALAVVNTTLLEWDAKVSHPWIVKVEVGYDGSSNHGLPDQSAYDRLDELEKDMMLELKDINGYLNVARETADNLRTIYFACADFRKPSKVIHVLTAKYADYFVINCDIYQDKYWQTFNKFQS